MNRRQRPVPMRGHNKCSASASQHMSLASYDFRGVCMFHVMEASASIVFGLAPGCCATLMSDKPFKMYMSDEQISHY